MSPNPAFDLLKRSLLLWLRLALLSSHAIPRGPLYTNSAREGGHGCREPAVPLLCTGRRSTCLDWLSVGRFQPEDSRAASAGTDCASTDAPTGTGSGGTHTRSGSHSPRIQRACGSDCSSHGCSACSSHDCRFSRRCARCADCSYSSCARRARCASCSGRDCGARVGHCSCSDCSTSATSTDSTHAGLSCCPHFPDSAGSACSHPFSRADSACASRSHRADASCSLRASCSKWPSRFDCSLRAACACCADGSCARDSRWGNHG